MLVLSFVVVTFAVWGVLISGFAVLLAAGARAYDDAVYAAFNTRIADLTEREAAGHIKGVQNIVRNTVTVVRGNHTVANDVKSLVGAARPATDADILSFYRDVSDQMGGLLSATERYGMYRLLPFCAESSVKGAAAIEEATTQGRLAERRGAFAAAPIVAEIGEAASVEELHAVYVAHLNRRRTLRFRALLDIRRLLKGRGPSYVVYWKRLISYSGKGGGVGALISYTMYNAPVMGHLAPVAVGGTVGLFAFVVKSASVITAGTFRGDGTTAPGAS